MSDQDNSSTAIAQGNQTSNQPVSYQELQHTGMDRFGELSNEQGVIKMQRASTITKIEHILRLQFRPYNHESNAWNTPDWPDVNLSKAAEEVMRTLCENVFWLQDWDNERMERTLIDVVLLDLLSANAQALAAKKMTLCRDLPVVTAVPEDRGGFITGTVDYALGFSTSYISVVVQGSNIHRALSRAGVNMRGVQQKRVGTEPNLMTDDTTYGMVSDGFSWGFIKLEGDKAYTSPLYFMTEPAHRSVVYRFVDGIIKSSISIAPTPANP